MNPDGKCGLPDGLSLCLLSSFHASRDGESVSARLGGRARQLLKILAANYRRTIPKDALIEMLWPDAEPSAGATSLKVTAHKLRVALDPRQSRFPWIISDNGTYRLNHEAPIWIDADIFRQHYDRGRSFQNAGRIDEATAEWASAEELYQGDYLEEDMYEEWTVIRREELRDVYLDTLQRLAHLAVPANRHSDVIRYCHKIVLADPCREDAYRMLMRSHAALGQFARAGAWYAVCRTTLQREVGAPPHSETVQVFENLFENNAADDVLHRTA
jgi:DNA-binding SARP family transcriptional activator